MPFLPVCPVDMRARGWDAPDFVLVTGDAYVDHPSFGTAVISRVLEAAGFRIAILPQPDWKSCAPFKAFGRPRLGFLVNAGNVDSMVAHYTAAKKRRGNDWYSAGGRAGRRPDRAVIVYCNRIREAYGDVPIVIGGIEASTAPVRALRLLGGPRPPLDPRRFGRRPAQLRNGRERAAPHRRAARPRRPRAENTGCARHGVFYKG